jgi:hypothetical protein
MNSPLHELLTRHAHYRLLDLGTQAGPNSYGSVNRGGFQILNNAGVVSKPTKTAMPLAQGNAGAWNGLGYTVAS